MHLPAASDLAEAEQLTKKETRDLRPGEALESIEKAQHILLKMQHKEDMVPMHWACEAQSIFLCEATHPRAAAEHVVWRLCD